MVRLLKKEITVLKIHIPKITKNSSCSGRIRVSKSISMLSYSYDIPIEISEKLLFMRVNLSGSRTKVFVITEIHFA